jgi:16S rRNA C967 or C1407 C5-methylase (RsmB/RsmF family)
MHKTVAAGLQSRESESSCVVNQMCATSVKKKRCETMCAVSQEVSSVLAETRCKERTVQWHYSGITVDTKDVTSSLEVATNDGTVIVQNYDKR